MTNKPDYAKAAHGLSWARIKEFGDIIGPALETVIEERLPVDVSTWGDDHTTWDGDRKTVDSTVFSPVTKSCSWSIFVAYEYADESLGFVDRERNLRALDKLQNALSSGRDALGEITMPLRLDLSKASSDRYRSSLDTNAKAFVAPDFNLLLVDQALQAGIAKVRLKLEEQGQTSRADRQAGSVVKTCREVWRARSGKKAPLFAHSQYGGDESGNPPPPPFVCFAEEIFSVLGIGCNANSALHVMRTMSN